MTSKRGRFDPARIGKVHILLTEVHLDGEPPSSRHLDKIPLQQISAIRDQSSAGKFTSCGKRESA
ncbi:hypothetical protein [Microbacterium testaceum]|uniref:hypothetical protein n=1 Tax=Microbacterium testaceum TaxID=2033 RepID=UPI0022E0A1A8|nr:hypothetical protein [Microbacterium testaceum]